jgi:hypothetical protein
LAIMISVAFHMPLKKCMESIPAVFEDQPLQTLLTNRSSLLQ